MWIITLIKLYILKVSVSKISLTTDPIAHYDMKSDEEMIMLHV